MLVYVLETFAYRRPACAYVPTYLKLPASPYSILVTETLKITLSERKILKLTCTTRHFDSSAFTAHTRTPSYANPCVLSYIAIDGRPGSERRPCEGLEADGRTR